MEKNAGNVQTSRLEGTTRDLVGLGVTASEGLSAASSSGRTWRDQRPGSSSALEAVTAESGRAGGDMTPASDASIKSPPPELSLSLHARCGLVSIFLPLRIASHRVASPRWKAHCFALCCLPQILHCCILGCRCGIERTGPWLWLSMLLLEPEFELELKFQVPIFDSEWLLALLTTPGQKSWHLNFKVRALWTQLPDLRRQHHLSLSSPVAHYTNRFPHVIKTRLAQGMRLVQRYTTQQSPKQDDTLCLELCVYRHRLDSEVVSIQWHRCRKAVHSPFKAHASITSLSLSAIHRTAIRLLCTLHGPLSVEPGDD